MNCTFSTTRWNWKWYDGIILKSCLRRCQLKLNGQRYCRIPLINSTCVLQKLNLNCCMCEKIQWYWANQQLLLPYSVCTDHAANNLLCINYPHSPSLSRMVTVVESWPGTNEAGAVALPEMTKLSVPSTRKSSITSTTRLWTLLLPVPGHNVNLWKTRWKSLFSASRVEECNSEWYKIIHSLTEIYCDL